MTMTGLELAEKLNVAKYFREQFIEGIASFYDEEFEAYYGKVKEYANKNSLAVDEDTVRNDMFEKLYELHDLVEDEREKDLIGDMAWDLVGDNLCINYGIDTVQDILKHKDIFLKANRKIAQLSYKENNNEDDCFGDYSQEYLSDNLSEMYDMLKKN